MGKISTTRLSNGRWRASVKFRPVSGEPTKRIIKTGRTEALATQAVKRAAGLGSGVSATNVGELADEWLADHQGTSTLTTERYQRNISRCLKPSIGSVSLADVDTHLVQSAIDKVTLKGIGEAKASEESGRLMRTILSMSLSWAATRGAVERNFARDTSVPKTETEARRKRPKAPARSKVDLLCTVLGDDLGDSRSGPKSSAPLLAAQIMRATGCRISEVCAVPWGNIDWEERTITFDSAVVIEGGEVVVRPHLKNYDPVRINHVPDWLYDTLKEARQEDGPIVSARGGGYIRPNNLRRTWRRAYNRAQIPPQDRVRPHDLRRYVGTTVARSLGADAAGKQLGDTLRVVELHYLQPDYTGPKEAAELL